jgi:hypothetical protein
MQLIEGFPYLYQHPLIVVNNIQRVFENATIKDYQEGLKWYSEAHDFANDLAKTYGIGKMKVAGIIAAMSPMKAWKNNKEIAEEFIQSGISGHTALQTEKAKSILLNNDNKQYIESTLGGLKTINFFNNIYNPSDEEYVTIDRHHLYISTGMDVQTCTIKQYQFIKKHTVMFSKSVNLTPCNLQAVLWVTWKRMKKDWECQRKSKELKELGIIAL